MNPDPQPWPTVTTFTYDATQRLTVIPARSEHDPPPMPQLPEPPPKHRAPLFTCEHDPEKGIFRIRWSDGDVEVFRDKPVRYLVVEPDDQTGELKPVVKRGCPTYLYLAREEREVR